jgi:hypothetical protein
LELKKNLEREKQARLEAERRAQDAYQKVQRAQVDKSEFDYQLVLNAIETVKARKEQLKSAYAEAMQTQDFAQAIEIQAEMSSNEQNLSDLKKGEKAMKERREAAEHESVTPAQQGDIVDQIAFVLRQNQLLGCVILVTI